MTKIAAQFNTVRAYCTNQADLLDTLTRIQDLGFDGVEMEFALLKNADGEILAAHLEKIGLEVASIRSPFARTEFGLEDMIAQAKQLHCINVGIGTITTGHYNQGPAALERYFAQVQQVCRRFKEEGLRPLYSLRNHEFLRLNDGLWIYDKLRTRTETAGMFFETDLLGLTRAAVDPERIFAQLAGRMPVCRLTDQKLRENDMYLFFPQREECPLGEGVFALPEWSEAAIRAGAEWFVVGQNLCDRDPFQCLEISREVAAQFTRAIQNGVNPAIASPSQKPQCFK